MKIIFSGGGTGGSVTPLISIYEAVKKSDPKAEFLWVAPRNDPVKELLAGLDIKVVNIFSGKLRRYFSLKNFIDPLCIFLGYLQARAIIKKFRPDWLVSAGSFVAVPLVWAAGKNTNILIHQQDVIPGLANKLMAKKATVITVALENSIQGFDKSKTRLVGNPVRPEIYAGDKPAAAKLFELQENVKTLLVVGGGTGAQTLNKLIFDGVPELVEFCQIIHLTGGKQKKTYQHPRYKQYDFLTSELKDALAVADLVVSRAGMGFLTELAALKKPTLIIPMPDSHQEANAREFYKNNAAVVVSEKGLTSEKLVLLIKNLFKDPAMLENYSRNLPKVLKTDAADTIARIFYEHYQS